MAEGIDVLKVVKELKDDTKENKIWFLLVAILYVLIYLNLEKIDEALSRVIDIQISSGASSLIIPLVISIISGTIIFLFWKEAIKRLIMLVSLVGYKWDLCNGLNDFYFQGNIMIDPKEEAIHIIQSDLGIILKNKLWKDYQLDFDFKIPIRSQMSDEDEEGNQLRRGFGVIYRARELGEYFMIKIDINGYHPHVRQILWENNGPIFKTSLTHRDLGKWIKARLVMRENILTVSMGKDNFKFSLPTHSSISRGYSKGIQNLPYSSIKFRNFGSVGFRSAMHEEVFIKNLSVRRNFSLRAIINSQLN